MLIPLTRAMAQGPMSPEREERLKEMERLVTIGMVALKRVWETLPDPEHQIPIWPPHPMKPGQLRRLAARMRAGLVPEGAVEGTVEDVENGRLSEAGDLVLAQDARARKTFGASVGRGGG